MRLALYRRLAEIEDEREIDSFTAELRDRFGPLPDEVRYLAKVMAIKTLCRRANVEKLDAGPKGAVIGFRDNSFAEPERLVGFIREQGSGVRMRARSEGRQEPSSCVFFDDWETAGRAAQRHRGDFAQAGVDRRAGQGGVTSPPSAASAAPA